MKEEGVTNILLIGNDSRENGEDGRSGCHDPAVHQQQDEEDLHDIPAP